MLRFECDYGEGAHPKILERLLETNLEQTPGYGKDEHCERAKTLIRQACGLPQSTIEFVTGGTQANQIVIAAILKPYQGVVCADTGHINTHETGAVEATGHKVLALPSKDGKITAQQIAKLCAAHWTDPSHEHTVQPGLVYLSQPTELGTLYTKAELKAIHQVCWQRHIPLYIDGARCGYGLAAPENDVTLADLAQLSDVFYIGGTKVGAMFGEAVVFTGISAPKYFFTTVKRHGALLAKGRMLGIQFDTLFTDGLYLRLSRHAIAMAARLKEVFARHAIPMACLSPTNQQFVILSPSQYDVLIAQVAFEIWERHADGTLTCRFVTSWATTDADIDHLDRCLAAL